MYHPATMSDDAYSASQLRSRYGPGGSENDSGLSASQCVAAVKLGWVDFLTQVGLRCRLQVGRP